MRYFRLLIISTFLLLPLCAFSADDAPLPASEEVEMKAPPVEQQEEEKTAGFREETGSIVRVSDGKVYVDHGESHGVTVGLEMDVYKLEIIEGLDGKVLDVEESLVGKIKVIEVRKLLSIAEAVEPGKEFERGFRVKFLLPEEEERQEGEERMDCPEGMIYFPSGGFAYYPSSPFKDSPVPLTEQEETTEGFCIDAEPVKYPRVIWVEALDACTKKQMRLCEKAELRKACTLGREASRPADEPGGKELKLNAFDSEREWGFDWKEAEDGASMEAGSCTCAGNRPSCFGCYYQNCGASKMKYRCCGDPM